MKTAQWADAVKQPAATRQDGYWLTISTNEDDHARVAALRRRGYAPSRHYAVTYRRDLTAPLPPSQLPAPYRFRHATDALLAERVAVHRDAWTLQDYKALRATRLIRRVPRPRCRRHQPWPLPRLLHLLVRYGRPRWPLRTGGRPARGKGLTRELIREGFRRLAERGVATAHTETPGFNTPARALYESSAVHTHWPAADVHQTPRRDSVLPVTAGAPSGSMF